MEYYLFVYRKYQRIMCKTKQKLNSNYISYSLLFNETSSHLLKKSFNLGYKIKWYADLALYFHLMSKIIIIPLAEVCHKLDSTWSFCAHD